MRTRSLTSVAAVGVLAFTLAACGDDGNDDAADTTATTEASAPADEPGTILDVAVAAGDFTTLVAAVEAAGLVETLSGEDELTVFAPTDAAFEALPAGALDKLMADPAGSHFIETDAECNTAARSLKVSATTVTAYRWGTGDTRVPHGCYFKQSSGLLCVHENPPTI